LADCFLELALGDAGREVEDGSERLCDVDADARVATPIGCDGHVDPDLLGCPQFPKVSGGAVAEDATVAGAEDGREVPALSTEATMADGIDAAVDLVEAVGADPAVDHVGGDAEIKQLPPTDDPMLPSGDARDCRSDVGGTPR
jgi:hypothetical protein